MVSEIARHFRRIDPGIEIGEVPLRKLAGLVHSLLEGFALTTAFLVFGLRRAEEREVIVLETCVQRSQWRDRNGWGRQGLRVR